jgi:SM-20-related protein
MKLRLDPGLDARRMGQALNRAGRIHLPGMLVAEDALAVGRALAAEDAPWVKAVQIAGRALDTTLEAWDGMAPDVRDGLEAAKRDAARAGFLYQFDAWRISDEIEAGKRRGGPAAAVEAVYDLINSEPYLAFIRELTGEPRAVYCDAMATRYRPGDFLTTHDDGVEGKNRLFAFVFNFTPVWRPDWGGLLLFPGQDGHIDEGFTPSFNALNLFRVPAPHTVTQVASFAAGPRLSVTGWIRSARDG